MSASRGAAVTAVAACLAALAFASVSPLWSDDDPTAAQAIERARALEKRGLTEEARTYLRELVDEDGGPLARDAVVLMEAARLAGSPTDCRAFIDRAVRSSRSSSLIAAAHTLLGDILYAEGLYVGAGLEYENAARHAEGAARGRAEIRQAECLLASGDAGAAVDAFAVVLESEHLAEEDRPGADIGMARALLAADRAEEAAERFERTAVDHPDHELRAAALAGAAESREALEDEESVVRWLTVLVDEYPDSYEAVLARERLRGRALPDTAAAGADTLSLAPER